MWIDDYVELVFGEDQSMETVTKGVNLKNQNMPLLLYKYRKISYDSLEALKGDFLYSSQPSEFNDIFEGSIDISRAQANTCQKTYTNMRKQHPNLQDRQTNSVDDLFENIANSFGGSYENCPDFMKLFRNSACQKSEKAFERIQRYTRNMYNICCFSETYDNDLMWVHYADAHKGFCIGYDIKNLNNDLTHLTLPVIYKENVNTNFDDFDKIDANTCMYALTVKASKWSYEKEWRTLFSPNPPSHKEQMPTPKQVFLGARISSEDRNKLKKICTDKGIALYQMKSRLDLSRLISEPV